LSNSSSGPRCFDVRPCLNQRAFFSLDRRFVNKESDEPFSGIVTVPTLDNAEQMSRVESTSISKNNSASTIRAPTASLKGLRVYMAEGDALRPKFRRYRRKNTGRGIAMAWLATAPRAWAARAGGGCGQREIGHFEVQGSVAKSTHAGISWLPFIRQRLGQRVHFWSFNGWEIPSQPGENDRSGFDSYDPPSDRTVHVLCFLNISRTFP
jgi:hypothetical protein